MISYHKLTALSHRRMDGAVDLVRASYGLCTVGGFDREKRTISLHAYKTNHRLTQKARVEHCRVLTWVAFRAFLISKTSSSEKKKAGKGKKSSPPNQPRSERLFPPVAVIGRRVPTGE